MKIIIVGGDFGDKPKRSSIIYEMHNELSFNHDVFCVNGGTIEGLKQVNISGYDLIFWMANIDNSIKVEYPKKDIGSVMVVSKVMRENRTRIDAVSRIFTMRGNAVIAVESREKPFVFTLIDALGNVWCDTTDVTVLMGDVLKFYEWTKGSKRIGTIEDKQPDLQEFININKQVADKFELVKGRYFGNASTRCSAMFPSHRGENGIYVSKRNSSKLRLEITDMVTAYIDNGTIKYIGKDKPSVDTPIQMKLYEEYKNINYLIHGHTYISGVEMTNEYFPCGDMREYSSIEKTLSDKSTSHGAINLKNHGFLIYADTLESLQKIVDNMEFIEREVGYEKINL